MAGIAILVVALSPRVADASPLDAKKAEAAQLAAKIETLGNRESALAEQYNAARLKAQGVDAQVGAARTQLAGVEDRAARARDQVRQVAIQQYMKGGSAPAATSPVGAVDPSIASFYRGLAAARGAEALDELRAAGIQLREKQTHLADAQRDARAATRQIDARRHEVQQAQAELTSTLAKVKGELATLVAQAEAARRAADAARASSLVQRASRNRGPLPPAPPTRQSAQVAVNEALKQVGKPYEWGAAGPDSFDCSGLTLWAWRAAGVTLPHYTGAQYSSTTHISLADLKPGDLVYSGDMGHMAMYIGNGNIVEAPRTGLNVRVVPMRSEFTLASRP